MSLIGEALNLLVQNQNLQAALGVKFEFGSGDRYIVRGGGRVKDGSGNIWDPIGDVGSISGLQLGMGEISKPLVFEISGLDPTFMNIYVNQNTELRGRYVTVYLMVFKEDWSLVVEPVPLRSAIMDGMKRRLNAQNRTTSITLTAESFTVTRFRAPNSFLTHSDQIARFPGDRGLEKLSGYTGPARQLYWN